MVSIYLLITFLFESFVLPLSIIFTIPLAFIGMAWGHVIGGLVTATLLTLLVVPMFYTLFDDLRDYLVGLLAWGRRRVPETS